MANEEMRRKHMRLLQMMMLQVAACTIIVIYLLKYKSRRRSRVPSRIRKHRKNAAEIRANGNDTTEESDDSVSTNDTIEESDDSISTNEVNQEVHCDTSRKRSSTGHSLDASSSRTRKRAKRVVEDDTIMYDIAKSFQKLVEVFERSKMELTKQNRDDSVEGIWAQLEDIGVERTSLPRVYVYLVQHPDALKAFNGIPVHKRKEFLAHIVPNYSPSN